MPSDEYRGRERRRRDDVGPTGRTWLWAGLSVVVLQFVVIDAVDLWQLGRDGAVVTAASSAAMGALAAVVAGTAYAHWRAVGHAAGLLVGAAGVLLGVVAAMDLVFVVADRAATGRLEAAVGLAAALWVARAVLGPEVDTRLRPAVEGLRVVVAVGLLLVLARGVEALGVARPTMATALAVTGAVVWIAVGLVGVVRATHLGQGLMGWVSWGALALGIGSLSAAAPAGATSPAAAVGAATCTVGLFVAAVGGIATLGKVALARRSDVHGLILDRRSREARDSGSRRVLAHELRNAMLVVEGAASTLDRHGDALDEDRRRQVHRALRTGIAGIRALVDPDPASTPSRTVAEAVVERVEAARARGLVVELRVEPDQPRVCGGAAAVATVVDNLLVNAERHGDAGGPGRPVHVSVGARGTTIAVRVTDHGPGIPPQLREWVFASGNRLGAHPEGEGLGLHVARQAARAHGGDLRCEAGPEGTGSCFVLTLPAVSARGDGRPRPDEVDDRG